MKKLFFLLMVCSLPAVGQQTPNTERMISIVGALSADSLLGRSSGTPESAKAAKFIIGQFKEIGIEPLANNRYQQEFSWNEMHSGRFLGCNIVGVVPGADPTLKNEYILIGAHYDHIGASFGDTEGDSTIYNGADDNASGVAGMLEVARMVMSAREKIGRSVIFVAFDAEEKGLYGSQQFLKHCPVEKSKIKAMVSMDMIGRADLCKGVDLTGICTAKGLDSKVIFASSEKPGLEVLTPSHISGHLFSTDTAPFYKERITSIMCSTGTKGPYHSPKDRVENIDKKGMVFVTDNMYKLLLGMSNCKDIKFADGIQKLMVGITAGVESGRFSIKHGAMNNKARLNYNAGASFLAYITPHSSLQADVVYKNVSSRSADMGIS